MLFVQSHSHTYSINHCILQTYTYNQSINDCGLSFRKVEGINLKRTSPKNNLSDNTNPFPHTNSNPNSTHSHSPQYASSAQQSALVAQLVERGTSNAEVYGSNPYGSKSAGWCSWLSRFVNTEKVLGSNPSLVNSFCRSQRQRVGVVVVVDDILVFFFRRLRGVVGSGERRW